MKGKNNLIIANIIVGFLWMVFCIAINSPYIIPALGFAGWTSYYIADANIKQSLVSNIAGILIGFTIIYLGGFNDGLLYNAAVTGLLTGFIIFLMRFKLTKNSAPTFIGGFTILLSGLPLNTMIISFVLGNILGLITDFIYIKLNKIIKE